VRPRRRRRLALAGLAAVIAAAAGSLVLLLDDEDPQAVVTGPLSEEEVSDVARAWADSYENEDPAAMRRVLTRGVERVLPAGTITGREEVVQVYRRQFDDNKTRSYDIDDLDVTAGRVGRASGSYRVERDGGDPIEGKIVLGVVRDRGEPRIDLIAATPAG
jgi:hypothetical protein